jgi:hypothetical protein
MAVLPNRTTLLKSLSNLSPRETKQRDNSVIQFVDELLPGFTDAFTDLADVPNSYVGQSGKVVAVKTTEDGLHFISPAGGGLTPVPVRPTTLNEVIAAGVTLGLWP